LRPLTLSFIGSACSGIYEMAANIRTYFNKSEAWLASVEILQSAHSVTTTACGTLKTSLLGFLLASPLRGGCIY
jgi:hypothetical protein